MEEGAAIIGCEARKRYLQMLPRLSKKRKILTYLRPTRDLRCPWRPPSGEKSVLCRLIAAQNFVIGPIASTFNALKRELPAPEKFSKTFDVKEYQSHCFIDALRTTGDISRLPAGRGMGYS
jgi:hypothetical protein